MKFEVTILGSGSATPTLNRNPSGQYLYINERHFLIDCGEGTQIQLRKYHIKFQKINHVFISHLHGDHYFGLIGFISSQHLLGRKSKLTIYSPTGLREIILTQLKYSKTFLSFDIDFIELNHTGELIIMEDHVLKISSFPLEHRIKTYGFKFSEKERIKNIRKETIEKHAISLENIIKIKKGEDLILDSGDVILNKELVLPSIPLKSYAYCSDTKFNLGICEHIKNCDLLYHEATFTEEYKDRAKKTFHSTAREAGEIALKSNVKKLILGHFSARYKDTKDHLNEAKEVFENSFCVIDGDKFIV